MMFTQSAYFVEVQITLQKNSLNMIRKEMEKSRAVDVSSNRNSECPPQKCFRCGSEDHMIAKCPNPRTNNEERGKQVHFNKKGNRACGNSKNNNDHKI